MCLHRRSNERCTSCSFTVQSVPHNMAGGYSSVDTVTFSSLCQCAMFLIMVLYNLCTLAYCSFYWDLTAFWQCVCFFCFFVFFLPSLHILPWSCLFAYRFTKIFQFFFKNFKQPLSKNFGQLLLFEILLNNHNYITMPGTHLRFAGLKHFF